MDFVARRYESDPEDFDALLAWARASERAGWSLGGRTPAQWVALLRGTRHRKAARSALQTVDARVLPALIAGANDAHGRTALESTRILVALQPRRVFVLRALAGLLPRGAEVARLAVEALEEEAERLILVEAELRAALQSPNWEQRRDAIELLGRCPRLSEVTTAALRERLTDMDPDVQLSARQLLVRGEGDPSAARRLFEQASQLNPGDATGAVEVLAELDGELLVEGLIAFLRRGEVHIHRAALKHALSRPDGSALATRALREVMEFTTAFVVSGWIQALGRREFASLRGALTAEPGLSALGRVLLRDLEPRAALPGEARRRDQRRAALRARFERIRAESKQSQRWEMLRRMMAEL